MAYEQQQGGNGSNGRWTWEDLIAQIDSAIKGVQQAYFTNQQIFNQKLEAQGKYYAGLSAWQDAKAKDLQTKTNKLVADNKTSIDNYDKEIKNISDAINYTGNMLTKTVREYGDKFTDTLTLNDLSHLNFEIIRDGAVPTLFHVVSGKRYRANGGQITPDMLAYQIEVDPNNLGEIKQFIISEGYMATADNGELIPFVDPIGRTAMGDFSGKRPIDQTTHTVSGINHTDWKNMLAYKFRYTLYNQILPAERDRLTNERSRINDEFYRNIAEFSSQAEGQDPPNWIYKSPWFWDK